MNAAMRGHQEQSRPKSDIRRCRESSLGNPARSVCAIRMAPAVTIRADTIYTAEHLRTLFSEEVFGRVTARCPSIQGCYHGGMWMDTVRQVLSGEKNSANSGGQGSGHALLLLQEAAEYLRMSERSLRRKVDAGLVEYVDWNHEEGGNRDLRFRLAALDRFILSSSVPAAGHAMPRSPEVSRRART